MVKKNIVSVAETECTPLVDHLLFISDAYFIISINIS